MKQPPKRTRGDHLHLAARAGIAAVPLLGGPATELFSALLAPPLQKRREEWLSELVERLKRLERNHESLRMDLLGEDDAFVSTLLRATQEAMRTHQKEKREALRNAVLNTALERGAEGEQQELFLTMIETLAPSHLRMLRFLAEYSRETRAEDLAELEETSRVRDLRETTVRMCEAVLRSAELQSKRAYEQRHQATNEEQWRLAEQTFKQAVGGRQLAMAVYERSCEQRERSWDYGRRTRFFAPKIADFLKAKSEHLQLKVLVDLQNQGLVEEGENANGSYRERLAHAEVSKMGAAFLAFVAEP